MAEIGALLQDVFRAQEGKLDDCEQQSLISKIEGALETSNTRSRQRVAESLKARNWDYIEGVLRNKLDEHEIAVAGGISVSTNAVANASVKIDFDIDQFIELSYAIDKSEGFTDEEKCQLKSLVGDMVKYGKSGDHVTFSDRAAKWLGMTADATELWVAFAPTIATILTSLANQLGG